MFLCKKCTEENFKNIWLPMSYGPCERCEETEQCADIPSKYLVPKKEEK